jgi:hypothetical protein
MFACVFPATELRSAKTYWHVLSPNPYVPRIFPGSFICKFIVHLVQMFNRQNAGLKLLAEIYTPKVAGMIWSMLAQQQTWFGAAAFYSYGIQLLPITPVSELRDQAPWVQEMLPLFNASCASDPCKCAYMPTACFQNYLIRCLLLRFLACAEEGWSILVYTSMATIGESLRLRSVHLTLKLISFFRVGNWEDAWNGVMQLPPAVFDTAGGNGHSLSNTLWYIGTRPQPNFTQYE